jgi:pSer/pThr/pTyr-binding forkhead associated (FHA) protein
VVLHPSGQRSRSSIDALPFLIGRQPDNHLVLRDNRASRMQARIVADNGSYVLEDLDSRHGTWVNGNRIARHVLRNSDRIDLGVPESYQLTFALESGGIHRILGQLSATPKSGGMGDNNLAKLRSLMEVARALQNSLSTQEVLTAVVDAALAVTGCERGFLLLRKGDALEVSVSRDLEGKTLEADDLRVPTAVIQRALNSRRELLSMSFDPGTQESKEGLDRSVAALELRGVVCVPLVLVQSGSMEETRMASHAQQTVGLLYLDSRVSAADLSAGTSSRACRRYRCRRMAGFAPPDPAGRLQKWVATISTSARCRPKLGPPWWPTYRERESARRCWPACCRARSSWLRANSPQSSRPWGNSIASCWSARGARNTRRCSTAPSRRTAC